MKWFVSFVLVAGLLAGCGDQAQKEVVEGEGEEKAAQTNAKDYPSVPIMIPCEACREDLSKRSTTCPNCGHPTPASVVAYKKARIRAEEERKRQEELARIKAEEERQKLTAERAEEERQRLAAERAVREKQLAASKAFMAKHVGKPYTIAGLSMEMLWCKPGTFEMGSPPSEKGHRDEETQHKVTLTQGFWLGKHEVTQAQWEAVMGTNPSRFKGANLPVEEVSWNDATAFCKKLTERERKAGRVPPGWAFALPTEAQWEYACRAGTKTALSFGETLSSRQGNFNGEKTTSVGTYPANPWGFFDMHGNVREWCHDWWDIYPTGAVTDPTGPAFPFVSNRVFRGGSWGSGGYGLRSAERYILPPGTRDDDLGFRVGFKASQ